MKPKWIVTWWNDATDQQAVRRFHTHEEAVSFQYHIKNKYNRHAAISKKGN